MTNKTTPTKTSFFSEKPKKNEWDLLLKLICFLKNNHKAIVHFISEEKNQSNYKVWAIVRFKRTNYLVELQEFNQILRILENQYHKNISCSEKKNRIYIRGASKPIEIPEYQDDLPF